MGPGLGRYAIGDIMLDTAILAVTLATGRRFMSGEWPKWSAVLYQSGLESHSSSSLS